MPSGKNIRAARTEQACNGPVYILPSKCPSRFRIMRALYKFVLLLVGIALWNVPSYAAEAKAEMKKVRLAYVGWEVGAAVSYVGIDGGIFKQNGIDVEEVFVRDPLSGGVQTLIGADFMVGFGNPLALIQPVLTGADVVAVA